jgi:hypothetical protein
VIAACVVIVVVVVAVAAAAVARRRRTERLKQHYGSEYERLVDESGNRAAAEKELAARERAHDSLDIVVLAPSALTQFTDRWQKVQTTFVDDPARAVGAADRLVNEVMRERGYPIDDFERRAADISVEHPQIVENYRAAHDIHLAQQNGDVSTERQREAFVHYRALFERLLVTGEKTDTSHEATA